MLDTFTWWHTATFVLLVSTATLAVMAWEYRKRIKELELSSRFDYLEYSMQHKLRDIKQENDDSVRSLWHAIEDINDNVDECHNRMDCCPTKQMRSKNL